MLGGWLQHKALEVKPLANSLTAIVLLLLMVVAQIALTLSSRSSLYLHHLIRLRLPRTTEALVGEVALEARRRMRRRRSEVVVIAHAHAGMARGNRSALCREISDGIRGETEGATV